METVIFGDFSRKEEGGSGGLSEIKLESGESFGEKDAGKDEKEDGR